MAWSLGRENASRFTIIIPSIHAPSMLSQAVAFLPSSTEVSGLISAGTSDYFGFSYSFFSTVPLDKCRDNTLK
jgi:hypothetical protein